MGNELDEDHSKRTVWTVADDKLLAAAYTIMSEGSIVGNAQKSESFWKRVVAYFNTNRAKGAKKRTAEKAKSHWASLKKIVNRYNGIYNKWYNNQPSGWSDEDLMVRAHEEYKNRWATKKARTSESSGAHTNSSNPNTTVDIDDREIRSRPMGQKAAKRKGKERGLGLLTLSSVLPTFHPLECNIDSTLCSPSKLQLALFYFSLYLVAVAQAGQKPCLQAFGADQFDDNDPEECNLKSSFFNWWTFCLIAGSTIATICLNYVQDNVSWVVGFGVSCVFMALGLLIFLLGTGTYRFYNVGHGKNPVSGASKALFTLFKKWQVGSEQEESRQALLSKAPDLANEEDSTANNVDREEAKGLFRLFPIWASCLIYAVVLSQASTFFTKQGSTMDRRLGSKFQVPSASLQCFIGISAIAFIPVYDRLLVPLARRFTGEPSGITMLQRIGTGVALSVVVMLVAAFVEMKRLRTCREMGLVDLPDEVIPMSMWWLMPQNVLCGIANVFAVVGLQEFFYDQVPEAFRSLGLAFCLSIFGVGNFISGFIVSAINLITSSQGGSWFPDNLNRAHLDYFYLLLAGLSAVELLIFLCSAQFYVYKTKGNPAM
ncbi:hypothetical protein ZIOFF_051940 [Zingiber officinale]|uniref:Uncharacterized protein n=1 Tax=Zingiber officinale TaxID=94328 RepID=A0A8J5FUC2_ZINOF|nr:hypothetical protein ZIOFF_051940 [Zingiber officinale]